MKKHQDPERLGPPDLNVIGFQLWIQGREFPDETDYDDGNWLIITAHCGEAGASVWVTGPIIQIMNIVQLREECEKISSGSRKEASLSPLEPGLELRIESTDSLGHLEMSVNISPDHHSQEHTFRFDIDQSYLPEIVRQCKEIEKTYKVRGI